MSSLLLKLCLFSAFSVAALLATLTMTPIAFTATLPHTNYCYNKLYNKKFSNIKIYLAGSSRLLEGIDVNQLARELDIPDGTVVNLAHSSRDYDYDYLILKRLIPENSSPLVLIETPSLPDFNPILATDFRFGDRIFGFNYSFGSKYSEIFQKFDVSSRSHIIKLHDKLRLIRYRMQRSVPITFRGHFFSHLRGPETNEDSNDTYCWRKKFSEESRLFRVGDTHRWISEAYWKPNKDSPDLKKGDIFKFKEPIDDILELSKKKPFDLGFLHIPSIRHIVVNPEYVREFEAQTAAPYITPTDEFLKTLRENSYADPSHFNPRGRRAYTRWLASEIKSRNLLQPDNDTIR